jgi:hypothetical protein
MKKLALGFASAATLMLGVAIAQPRPDAGMGTPPPASHHPGMGPGARGMAPGECGCMQGMGQGRQGGMMQQGACPHAQAIGSVRAENTKDGAVLRFTAKSAAQAAQVQAHVQMMARCISAHHGGAADGGTPAR